jgi:hypothetical protein
MHQIDAPNLEVFKRGWHENQGESNAMLATRKSIASVSKSIQSDDSKKSYSPTRG